MVENESMIDEMDEETIRVNDKRRFNADGESIADTEVSKEPVRSALEVALEADLKVEKERRGAAEAKLVGVQAKFDEAKARLEKETTEMRTRLMRSLEDRSDQAKVRFLITLLPVLDNLNLAIAASETDPSVDHLRDGVIGTARSFERALIDVGVETVESIGSDFDPELHEAVDIIPVDAEKDGKIIAEYSKGFRFRDKLLRPARVQVGKSPTRSISN